MGEGKIDLSRIPSRSTRNEKGWDIVTEIDIEEKIKKFWKAKEKLVSEGVLESILERVRGFINPDDEHPVDASEFLSHLDVSPLIPIMEKFYWRPRELDLPMEAMLKSSIYMVLKRYKYYTELERDVESHPDVARNLGFRRTENGYRIPNHRTFWHWDNVRMSNSRIDNLFKAFREEIRFLMESIGKPLGEESVEDATPIRAQPNDKEAEYNAHYKMKGYKLEMVSDRKEHIPFAKEVIGINEDEGSCLLPSSYQGKWNKEEEDMDGREVQHL